MTTRTARQLGVDEPKIFCLRGAMYTCRNVVFTRHEKRICIWAKSFEMRDASCMGKLYGFLRHEPENHFDVGCFERTPQNRKLRGFIQPSVALSEEEPSDGNP